MPATNFAPCSSAWDGERVEIIKHPTRQKIQVLLGALGCRAHVCFAWATSQAGERLRGDNRKRLGIFVPYAQTRKSLDRCNRF
jgi:hypothetical protein